ncbi:hypothetical protein F4821DRAFT_145008 [Hypoxylon rubiginosum]|uniref:Uncharacterized protein n=1 Tax=Hypoxylon rubiginosum TaxID=110542 RepID=A0ACC0CZ68_9PEZI|nr:hypothetical protein F4821DRAFT_145008 [Hypoxylon rubiginosum]
MSIFLPAPAYVLGTACLGRGLMALLSPRKEYGHVGLPLESQVAAIPSTTSKTHANGPDGGFASPLMYFKGIREISYGLVLIALQGQGSEKALTTFAAVLSLVRFGDGLVVWLYGNELRWNALGHWITGAGFAGWVAWRWNH